MLELKKKLKLAENNYLALYELAPVGYFDLDESTRIIKVNLTGAQLLDTPRSQLCGKRFSTFISKNSQSIFYTHLKQVFMTQIKQPCKLELLKKNGSVFYSQLESVTITDVLQPSIKIHVSVIDINEHRLTEQSLRFSEEKFRSLIETTKEWIWTIDLKGRFLYSNPAVKDILGYSPTELLNCNRITLLHKNDRSIITKSTKLFTREKQGWSNLTLRWRCKDGTYRYLESNAVPFFNSEGKLLGYRGSDRDITIRKQSEEKKYHQQSALNHVSKMNSLGEFSSALAHELTQPLTAINNYITGCIKRLNLHTSQDKFLLHEALQQAAKQAERAGKIIHRMKDFAKHGKMHFETVDLNNIIHESILLIQREFSSSNLNINFEENNSQMLMTADGIQLEQVMLNLLRNSIEAMNSAATLNPEIKIKYEHYSNQRILVRVRDNGPGFCSKQNIDELFKACFTTKTYNLGMGLAISRTIIEAHYGQLTCYQNTSNKGVSFQFILPIYQENHG
jgi:two-component system sensor kinase FixL